MEVFKLIIIILLIAITAFFVAAEFSIVKVRKSRIEQLVREGNKKAISVQKIVDHLDSYLSATQLGITMTSLGLGWLGQPTVEFYIRKMLHPFSLNEHVMSTLAFIIAFSIITFFNVVLGELAPKTIAIQRAEQIVFKISTPLIIFNKMMYPFIWLLNQSAWMFTRLLGFKRQEEEQALSEEELRHLLSQSYLGGEINQSEYQFVNKIFEFDNRTAKEVMVPRTEMVCIDHSVNVEEALEVMKKERYSRYPVMEEDKDHIVGVIHLKHFLQEENLDFQGSLDDYIHPIIVVFESIHIHDLLVQMQKERIHMAVLVDEYGGTAGLVTVEDIIEEIVGEIRDEFDIDEQPMIRRIKPNELVLNGKVLIQDVNKVLRINIESDEIDTIGGWMLTEDINLGVGSSLLVEGYEFQVVEMDGHTVKKIKVVKQAE
ncbi:hemolysin family protein [Massilibacterium senegalense]|uniref:hemolysin family protein n=1 Tax=Massilibacterium senegalense TaxID=1632858 RepID=UPI000781492F|nr:hemolysin family protein [Massilibacterium senegalense]